MENIDFFISYNKADRGWAEWIAWELEEAGYKCYIQAWDFITGSNFVHEMQKGTRANRTLLVLSPDYLTSKFTQAEWYAAFAQDPTGEDRKVFAIKVRECHPEGLLSSIIWLNFVGLSKNEAQKLLLTSAKGERIKPELPPPFPGEVEHSVPQEPPFPGTVSPKTVNLEQTADSNNEKLKLLLPSAKQRLATAVSERPPNEMGKIWLQLVSTPLKNEEAFDPNLFLDQKFLRKIVQLTRQGESPLFDDMSAVSNKVNKSNLIITQTQEGNRGKEYIRLVLYNNGTLSVSFSKLHQIENTSYSFSRYYIDQDIVYTNLVQAFKLNELIWSEFDTNLEFNPILYNIAFFDIEGHRFGKTPAGQVTSYSFPTRRTLSDPVIVYEEPRTIDRGQSPNVENLTSHAITR